MHSNFRHGTCEYTVPDIFPGYVYESVLKLWNYLFLTSRFFLIKFGCLKRKQCDTTWGPEGQYVVLWGCILTKHRKCHVFLPSLMYACPLHGVFATCIWQSCAKTESEFPTLQNGDLHLREKILREKHRSSRIARGCHRADSLPLWEWLVAIGRRGPTQGCSTNIDDVDVTQHIFSTICPRSTKYQIDQFY
jgi:hypothetical protein